MSLDTSCRQRGFLLCVSSSDISECLLVHPGDKWPFFCVYLLVMFQNVLSHILQAKGFSLVCIFSWCFRMSCHTSCRQRAFILCVSSHDISGRSDWKKVSSHIPQAKGFSPVCILLITFTECSLTHPSGKCLFSLVYLIVMFQNVSLHITSYRQRASLLCVSSPVSSHILHTNCFSAVCIFSWHFKMSRHISRRQMDFLLCVSSHDVSEFPPPKVTSFMDSQSGVWLYP